MSEPTLLNNPLHPFPFPENWLDLCDLCKFETVSAIAQEHDRVAELYNNARRADPYAFRVYCFSTLKDRRDRTWLGVRLQATRTQEEYFVCALGNVPLVCECKRVEWTEAEKDAILARATPGLLWGEGDGARL